MRMQFHALINCKRSRLYVLPHTRARLKAWFPDPPVGRAGRVEVELQVSKIVCEVSF